VARSIAPGRQRTPSAQVHPHGARHLGLPRPSAVRRRRNVAHSIAPGRQRTPSAQVHPHRARQVAVPRRNAARRHRLPKRIHNAWRNRARSA
jgi:hypothetical protein